MSQTTTIFIVGIVVAIIVAFMVLPLVQTWVRSKRIGQPYIPIILKKGRNAVRAVFLVIGLKLLLGLVDKSDSSWSPVAQHILTILMIGAVTWLLVSVANALEDVLTRNATLDKERGRRFVTQISLLRRLLVAIIVTIGIALMLMTFPAIRVLGQAIFVSAGVLSIVAGLAAQTTLTNTFAGIQIALSNSLRVDDFVSVEGNMGRVADITLTYVVIHIWDDRRIIYPTSQFVSHSFENWTRSGDAINGSAFLDVDWAAPFDDLRIELDRFVRASPLWDGRSASLIVTEATDGKARIQIIVSAASASKLFALQSAIREAMIRYIVEHAPEGVYRSRYESLPR